MFVLALVGIVVILILLNRILSFDDCPFCKRFAFDSLPELEQISSTKKQTLFKLTKKCRLCGHTETQYLVRTYDAHGMPIDNYTQIEPV